MKTKNIIIAVALAALLGTALTLSARCALAQATQTTVVKSTEGQSETEPSVPTEVQSAPKTIASTAFTDRSTPLPAQKFKFVSKRSHLSSFTDAAKRLETEPQNPPSGSADAEELAKKLSNPVASLISFPMQSNFDFGMGGGSGWRYTLNVQPVIPIALSPKWNLISRTIIPIIHQGNVTGPNQSQSGLGDTVQSLFFSPNKSEPFIWAVGPVFLLPTATDAALGAQKWGVGPTALVLKQKKGWTYGVLANHIWSVAGKSNRAEVNATFIQPIFSYTTKDAWTYSLNTESTYDWNSHSWSTPINFNISKLVRFGKQPISFGAGPRCWVTSPTGGAEGCGVRIVVTALFPKK
ncbi:MAG: hypothetical protein ND866_30415 [Pyrinomonadaceae bacterium]|nr:hypothetical protein [Pyrinomonadaceae bacterium]